MEIRRIKPPRQMTYDTVMEWQQSWRALERYENHLLKQERIWDTSRQALQTLLILNLNMRYDPEHTLKVLHNYTSQRVHAHPDFMYLRTGKFLLGQLRLNIVNPYACKLYEMQTLELRFDKILQLVRLTRDENDNNLTYMPGSCSPNVEPFILSRLNTKRYRDNPINIGIDWFCYWLQPLLFNIDHSNANNDATVDQIIEATKPFMTHCGQFQGFCLDVDKNKLDPNRKPPLNLEQWPLGKPILYHACEKGSLSMLKFCLHGLTPQAKTTKVNTPRRREMIKQGYIAFEIENYAINTAAFYGHLEIVYHLLSECNADTFVQNYWEETPFRSAQWAWRETSISDPVRSANCFQCMALISQYQNRTVPRVDETYRGQVHRQRQLNMLLAQRYIV